MKTKYCFHLGREPKLSLAELRAVFGHITESHGSVAIIEEEPFKRPQTILNQLGGTMKISQVISKSLEDQLEEQKPEGKIAFGLNVYPFNELFLNKTLKKLKQNMKSRKRNVRFLNKKTNLGSATIVKGGLLEKGTDLNVVHIGDKNYFTQTVAVQDFVSYSMRDYEKPARLAKEGMLPPKLAQMMINLTAMVTDDIEFKGRTLYDPFCGSGTVLGEALIKGLDVIGSDLDPKAIEASTKNLNWLRDKNFASETLIQKLFVKDAQELTREEIGIPPNMIVSETYLGPPCHPKMPAEAIKEIHRDLLPLYKTAFTQIHALMRKEAPVVIAFPIHYFNNHPLPVTDLIPTLQSIGYKHHESFTYHRPDQAVGREIMVLETK